MNAADLYRAGKLDEAIKALNEEVKTHPMDLDQRGFLSVLLCFAGNLDRADLQLDAMMRQDPAAAPGISLMRQLVRAEQARQQFYREGRVPEFLSKPNERASLHLQASIALREEEPGEAARLLEQSEGLRKPVRGTLNGEPFEDFRDLDDLNGGFFEVLTSTGKYYWVPVEEVIELSFTAPERPRDLLWRQATMSVREGPEGQVYFPAIYAPVDEGTETTLRLGRATDWVGGDGTPVLGRGLRTFLADEQDVTILDLRELTIERGEGA